MFSDAKNTAASLCEFCLDGGTSLLGAGLVGWLGAAAVGMIPADLPSLAAQLVGYGSGGAGFAYTWSKMRAKTHIKL